MSAPDLIPTAEQSAILSAANASPANLLISALAGCAKTSTLVMIAHSLRPRKPILSLAFNKRIALEMRERMPVHVECATLNSLGHRSWASRCSAKLNLDSDKSFSLVKGFIDGQPAADRKLLWEDAAALRRSLDRAKINGLLPADLHPGALDPDLLLDDDEALRIIERLLHESIAHAREGRIDFNDQLYMPTLFGGQFPNFPTVMVDEAQDLSPLNHQMLCKIARQRLIAVGDPNQAIYGFRGAVAGGMAALRAEWGMEELPLSVTFRCPRALVERARYRVPHFTAAPEAPEGQVLDLTRMYKEASFEDLTEDQLLWTRPGIPEGAALICRNNAPLLRCALELIRGGRGVELVGSDIGPALIKTLEKFGETSQDREAVHAEIDRWEAARIKRKPQQENSTRDRADCLRVFADAGSDLGSAIEYARRIFSAKGPIQLLSGHKAKGLEWHTVYHIDPWRIPARWLEEGSEAYEQDLNVRYVIETRAKSRLILVNSEDL